jgi:hypothetical protein
MGDWIKLDDGRSAKIVKIEFKTGSDVNSERIREQAV